MIERNAKMFEYSIVVRFKNYDPIFRLDEEMILDEIRDLAERFGDEDIYVDFVSNNDMLRLIDEHFGLEESE